MQQAKIENKAAGSRVYTLPCREWQVDEAACIEIRDGVIFGNGVARIDRHETGTCSERRDGLRGTGCVIRGPIRPGPMA
jgi:hypothetical protein